MLRDRGPHKHEKVERRQGGSYYFHPEAVSYDRVDHHSCRNSQSDAEKPYCQQTFRQFFTPSQKTAHQQKQQGLSREKSFFIGIENLPRDQIDDQTSGDKADRREHEHPACSGAGEVQYLPQIGAAPQTLNGKIVAVPEERQAAEQKKVLPAEDLSPRGKDPGC